MLYLRDSWFQELQHILIRKSASKNEFLGIMEIFSIIMQKLLDCQAVVHSNSKKLTGDTASA